MRKSRMNEIMKRATGEYVLRTKPETESRKINNEDFVPSSKRPSKPLEYDEDIADFVSNVETQVDDWLQCKELPLDFFDSDDSVKDKDYFFRESDESTDQSIMEDEVQGKHASKSRNRKQKKNSNLAKQTKTTETGTDIITTVAEIHLPSKISKKSKENEENAIQKELNYEKLNTGSKIIELEQDKSVCNVNDKLDEQLLEKCEANEDMNKHKIFVVDAYGIVTIKEIKKISEAEINTDAKHDDIQLTKKGTVRKRRKYTTKLKDRKKIKTEEKINQFKVKLPCSDKCAKKCKDLISEERRQEINEYYWKLNRQAQTVFVTNSTTKSLTKIKTKTDSQRKFTYKYFFKSSIDEESSNFEVCKHFFLTTLGYHPKNDYTILKAISHPDEAIVDKRGRHAKNISYDRTNIHEHIMSFGPAVSHYRREHAPNKKYLPSDLSINKMYNHFKEKYPDSKCSYELYRYVLKKELNISLAKLGNEECETCEVFNKHDDNHTKNPVQDCNVCKTYKEHKVRVAETREEYKRDAEKKQDLRNNYYSADLQKIIMLPRLETFKSVIFCPRLIVFNESFVPVGTHNNSTCIKTYAVIWHEAVSGRRKEDIASTFYQFFKHKRDIENITIWTDNCASQNKCWTLFSFLVYVINSENIAAKTITLRYFEPGHSFMSADSFHHQVEQAMKRNPKIYDFDDFHKTVQSARSGKVDVKTMGVEDFYNFEDYSSAHRLKNAPNRLYLREIVEVQVRRGFFNLYIKKCFRAEDYAELQFLKVKYEKNGLPVPVTKTTARGISKHRKSDIITKLGPLMPSNRLLFWQALPENDLAVDLYTNNDDGCD